MTGSDALVVMLSHVDALVAVLPHSAMNKSIAIRKDKVHLTGIHMNALEFNSERWAIGRACEVCEGTGCTRCEGGLVWTTEN